MSVEMARGDKMIVNILSSIAATQFLDLPARALDAFLKSFAFMIVVLFAAIPWVCLFLVASWGALKFLRWWYRRRKEHLKEKNRNPEPIKTL